MSKTYAVHVCSFQSGPEIKSRTTYAEVKAAVLEAGRFSTFDATDSPKAARIYTRLCKDPEVERFDLGFPWIGVRRKDSP